jgi:hypothetical protein
MNKKLQSALSKLRLMILDYSNNQFIRVTI